MYPIMLDMKEKKAVIVGGGEIAYRKLIRLLQAGARIIVISPTINQAIKNLWTEQKIIWKKKNVEAVDLEKAFIIIGATNNKSVNAFVASCVSKQQLVNIVDDRTKSDFYTPALFTRGDLVICVSTNGASPILAKQIRDEISEQYSYDFKNYVSFLSIAREQIKHLSIPKQEKNFLLSRIIEKDIRHSNEIQENFLQRINQMKKDPVPKKIVRKK